MKRSPYEASLLKSVNKMIDTVEPLLARPHLFYDRRFGSQYRPYEECLLLKIEQWS